MVLRICLGVFKDITHSPEGMNFFIAKVAVDFISQSTDQHIHHIGLGIETVIPDMLENHGLGKDSLRISHEIFKQGKLPRLQINLCGAPEYFSRKQVQRQIVKG